MSTTIRTLAMASALTLAAGIPAADEAKQPLARNVILFIADGWSQSLIDATNYFHHGRAKAQPYERWFELPMATYAAGGSYDPEQAWADFDYVKSGATDSAAAGTALATGVLTTSGRLGLDPDGNPLRLITEAAHEVGKAAGSIADVMYFHATPAAFGAKVERRNMYPEIVQQMIEESKLSVVMGAGHPYYDDDAELSEEPRYDVIGGHELWHRLAAGEAGNDLTGDDTINPWLLIETREEFQALASGEGNIPSRVAGVARVGSTLQYNRDGDKMADAYEVPFNEGVPTLAEMTRAALNVLNQNENGFFLMSEGGAIDWAGHGNNPGRIIEEMTFFNEAVQAAIDWVEEHSSWDETLIVVTGDHDCGYLMGPDADPDFQPVENKGKGNMPGMAFYSTGHTNQLIPLFLRGPGVETLAARTEGVDPVLGPFVQIATVGQFLIEAVAGE